MSNKWHSFNIWILICHCSNYANMLGNSQLTNIWDVLWGDVLHHKTIICVRATAGLPQHTALFNNSTDYLDIGNLSHISEQKKLVSMFFFVSSVLKKCQQESKFDLCGEEEEWECDVKGEEAVQDCASGPRGGENIFSGLGLKERLGYINTHPSHFHPFWLRHTILIMWLLWPK